MKHQLLSGCAKALWVLFAALGLAVGGTAFAYNLQVLAAEVSMTSSTTITECPEFESELPHDAVCLVGESIFGSLGVDLAKSGVQLAALKAGLTPVRGWTQKGAQLSAGWVNATVSQGLLVMIQEANGVFVIVLVSFAP